MSRLGLSAIVLFFVTAVLHFAQLPLYGINQTTIGYSVSGIIYLILGCLLFIKKRWTLWAGIIYSVLGVVISLIERSTATIKPTIYPLLLVINAMVVILCIVELNRTNRLKNHKFISSN